MQKGKKRLQGREIIATTKTRAQFHCATTQKKTNQSFLGEPLVFSVVFGDKLTEPETLQCVKSMWALTCYHDTIETDTTEHRALWEQMNSNTNPSRRCHSILHCMRSYTSLFWLLLFYLFIFFPTIVNSSKSHPPHSVCGLLRSGGLGGWWLGCGRKITKNERCSFTQCSWGKLPERLVMGDYLRLRFSMRAVVDRYFLHFLFPKLTPMRPNLHKQTVEDLCHLACGCRLQQLVTSLTEAVPSLDLSLQTACGNTLNYVICPPPPPKKKNLFVNSPTFVDLNLVSCPPARELSS